MNPSVFKQLMQVISMNEFKKIVHQFNGDKYSKSFTSWNHLQLMVYFQLTGRTSIRDVINSLKSKINELYHSGLKVPSRNNLSAQNSKRDYRIFQSIFYTVKNRMQEYTFSNKRSKFKFKETVKSFDSSTISLCKELFGWARFRKNKSGIKMHYPFK
jgi:hypothetical protein